MEKIYRVNLIYSIIIIAAGIFGLLARYFEQGDWKFTALIPAVFGLVLLFMTGGMKRQNRIVSHLVVVRTLVLAIMVTVMMILNLGEGSGIDRKIAIFMVIIAASIVALGYYIASFVAARRNKDS